ncbi:hypothetical protein [Parvularcula sp. LCG005]|uniref:hypothetical protein n=1 Tax=Parvularcula sp. LCG005 TaxID=3078805 RepID=UPI002942D7D6|nr:hypothetical protein [Parvularcula sp. LCG005]WOI53609.1 hypothetical protein RUI03_01115 [Parvularcula sp. LCG005]
MNPQNTPPTYDMIIALDAGQKDRWSISQFSRAKNVVVANVSDAPNPEFERLRQAGTSISEHAVAVTADASNNVLQQFNLPGLSSSRQPTGLIQLYPGLKVISSKRVQTVHVVDFIKSVGVEKGYENRLILPMNGEEGEYLELLAGADLLTIFTSIHVSVGRTALFEGAPAADEVIATLRNSAFIALDTSPNDPHLATIEAALDKSREGLHTVTKRLNSTLSANEVLTATNDDLREQLSATEKKLQTISSEFGLAKKRADRVPALERQIEDLHARIRKIDAEFQRSNIQLSVMKDLMTQMSSR